jgi:hypothetical protein
MRERLGYCRLDRRHAAHRCDADPSRPQGFLRGDPARTHKRARAGRAPQEVTVKPRRWKLTRGRGTLVVCDDLTIHVRSYGPASWSYWYEILGAQIGGEDDDLPRRKDAEWVS